MSTQVEIESIEALDFEYTPPCESPVHGDSIFHTGDAYALVSMTPDCCGKTFTGYRCQPIVRWALDGRLVVCPNCRVSGRPQVKILAYVDGA